MFRQIGPVQIENGGVDSSKESVWYSRLFSIVAQGPRSAVACRKAERPEWKDIGVQSEARRQQCKAGEETCYCQTNRVEVLSYRIEKKSCNVTKLRRLRKATRAITSRLLYSYASPDGGLLTGALSCKLQHSQPDGYTPMHMALRHLRVSGVSAADCMLNM